MAGILGQTRNLKLTYTLLLLYGTFLSTVSQINIVCFSWLFVRLPICIQHPDLYNLNLVFGVTSV